MEDWLKRFCWVILKLSLERYLRISFLHELFIQDLSTCVPTIYSLKLFQGKLIAEEYDSALQARHHPDNMDDDSNHSGGEVSRFEAGFIQALEETYKDIVDAFHRVGLPDNTSVSKESLGNSTTWNAIFESNVAEVSLGNITTWNAKFESNVASLKLGAISDGLVKTINFAVSFMFSLLKCFHNYQFYYIIACILI